MYVLLLQPAAEVINHQSIENQPGVATMHYISSTVDKKVILVYMYTSSSVRMH